MQQSCDLYHHIVSGCPVQLRLNQEQGSNAVLRSSLDRKERERDDLQKRMQQLSSQPSGLTSFNMAEAQKQVATLTQQLAFKEEEVRKLIASVCACT